MDTTAQLERLNARYPGYCAGCGRAIRVGSPIVYNGAEKAAVHAACETALTTPAPIVVIQSVEDRGDAHGPGDTLLDAEHGAVTVVRSTMRYLRGEDGDGLGLPDGGWLVVLRCRVATREEAARQRARAIVSDRIMAARARLQRLRANAWRWERPADGPPDDRGHPTWVTVPIGQAVRATQIEEFILPADQSAIWMVQDNGMDGDDWTKNNLPGGVATCTAWDAELAAELRQLGELTTMDDTARAAMIEAEYRAIRSLEDMDR